VVDAATRSTNSSKSCRDSGHGAAIEFLDDQPWAFGVEKPPVSLSAHGDASGQNYLDERLRDRHRVLQVHDGGDRAIAEWQRGALLEGRDERL
jgi:hypothetical protein